MADEKYTIRAEVIPEISDKAVAELAAAIESLRRNLATKIEVGLDTAKAIREWEALQEELSKRARNRRMPVPPPIDNSPSNSPPASTSALNDAFLKNQKAKLDALIRELSKNLENLPAGVDADRLREDLDRKIKEASDTLRVSIPVDEDGAHEWRDKVKALIEELNDESIRLDVDAVTGPVAAKLKYTTRTRTVEIIPYVSQKALTTVATQLAALSGARLGYDWIKRLSTDLQNLDRSLPKIAGVTAGISSIWSAAFSAVGAVGMLGAGLAQLGGAAGLLPALLGAAGASIGTLLASFKGVGTALGALQELKAPATVSPIDARSQAIQAAQAAEAIIDAEQRKADAIARADERIVDAQNAVTESIEAETQARKDNTAALAVGLAAQANAAARAKQAARALEVAQSDGASGSRLDQLKRESDTANAALLQQQTETEKLAKQESKNRSTSVSQSERVLKAQEDLLKAQEERTKAEVDGSKAVENALRSQELQQLQLQAAAAAAGIAAVDAMNNLTPSAREAVQALSDVYDRLGGVRRIAQERFFDGFADPLLALADTVIPQLEVGVGNLAGALGDGFDQLMRSLDSGLGGGVLERMFGNTADAQRIINETVIDPLTQAILTLGDVGSSFLPQLASSLGDVLTRFNEFIQRTADDGSLAEWIQTGIDAFGDLFDVIGGLAGILGAIGKAGAEANDGGLSGLAATLHDISDTMNSPEFQEVLVSLFKSANAFFAEASKAIGPLGEMFKSLAPTLEQVLPLLGEGIATALEIVAGIIGDPAFREGLLAFSEGLLKGIQGLIPAIGPLAGLFGGVMEVVGKLASVLGPVLGEIFAQMAPLILELVEALAPLIDALGVGLMDILPPLIDVLVPLVEILARLMQFLTEALLPILVIAIQGVLGFVEMLVNAFGFLVSGNVIDSLGDWFVEITNGFMNWIDDIVDAVTGFPETVINAIVDGFRGGAGLVGDAFGEVLGGIFPFLPHSPAKKGPLALRGWNQLASSSGAVIDELAAGARKRTPVLERVWNEVAETMLVKAPSPQQISAQNAAIYEQGSSVDRTNTVSRVFAPVINTNEKPETIVAQVETKFRNEDL